jgi:hypothetical protein
MIHCWKKNNLCVVEKKQQRERGKFHSKVVCIGTRGAIFIFHISIKPIAQVIGIQKLPCQWLWVQITTKLGLDVNPFI